MRLHRQLEAMLREGRHQLVLQEAERLWQSGTTAPSLLVWVAVWACRAAGGVRNWGLASDWAERGLDLESKEVEARGILSFSHGRALLFIGDLIRSEREWRRFLEVAASCETLRRVEPDARYNLGLLLRTLGRTEEAFAEFARASQRFSEYGRSLSVALCHYETAWTLLLERRHEEAGVVLEQTRAALVGVNSQELETDLAIALALYHSQVGEAHEADRICGHLQEAADLAPRQRADIAWILGSNALLRGDLALAAAHLTLSHEAAVQDWWPPQLERINQLRENLLAQQGTGR